jgi:hypothetical protein
MSRKEEELKRQLAAQEDELIKTQNLLQQGITSYQFLISSLIVHSCGIWSVAGAAEPQG